MRLNRRQMISAMASAGVLLGGRQAFGQARVQIDQGNVAPLPIAIPNFVAGSPSDGEVGAGVGQVITNNPKRSGFVVPVDQAV